MANVQEKAILKQVFVALYKCNLFDGLFHFQVYSVEGENSDPVKYSKPLILQLQNGNDNTKPIVLCAVTVFSTRSFVSRCVSILEHTGSHI